MMYTPHPRLILVKGEPKSLQIEATSVKSNNSIGILYKGVKQWYNYNRDDVVFVEPSRTLLPEDCKVFKDNRRLFNIDKVIQFKHNGQTWWRIKYDNGHATEYHDNQLTIKINGLATPQSKKLMEYLHCVASLNPIGQEIGKNESGILEKFYQQNSFVEIESAASCYLCPSNFKPQKLHHSNLIFPFGCNASQKSAVSAAFEHQISIIQGPPGTGKTQTILNIIANIVGSGKSVIVVSNNNAATLNVHEKLTSYGMGFIVAPLGNNNNKELFLANQPALPNDIRTWRLPSVNSTSIQKRVANYLDTLDKVYGLQNRLAQLNEEKNTLLLEWKHFQQETTTTINDNSETDDNNNDNDNNNNDNNENVFAKRLKKMSGQKILQLWMKCQQMIDEIGAMQEGNLKIFEKWKTKLNLWWMTTFRLHGWGFQAKESDEEKQERLLAIVETLQRTFYPTRLNEIETELQQTESLLEHYDAEELAQTMTSDSLTLFKNVLYQKYSNGRPHLNSLKDIKLNELYPVVLSTTFCACNCRWDEQLYDYIIMDEASQVSVETGALALTCARNAVIVGDAMQLPNVVTDGDKQKLDAIRAQYGVSVDYDCGRNSFLQSICAIVQDAPQTLLREHYRCHPRIINFCNQKFYGGKLLIMTKDKGEPDVISVIKTVRGNHANDHRNQREIDVIKNEVLPQLKGYKSIGIVSPYNHQVNALSIQLPDVESATVHKYQGREKDAIVMSVVDNQITPFADNPNLLNVAVSRAKKRFCLVVTGNEQKQHGNITDLIDYIAYNNCTVTNSKVSSIFDYLYGQYTHERLLFLRTHPTISEYASENLTYALLQDLLDSQQQFACYNLFCHVPLRQIIRDYSLLTPEETAYARNPNSHIDFLIASRVSKRPVLAIETDGYSFHNDTTKQHQRDLKKNHILNLYNLPLLRLSTKGSNERERVVEALNRISNDPI